jgi:hypothetical protein
LYGLILLYEVSCNTLGQLSPTHFRECIIQYNYSFKRVSIAQEIALNERKLIKNLDEVT